MVKHPKIALIGAGKWGKKLLSELSALADVKFVVSKGSKETTSFLKENYPSINFNSNIDDVLKDPEIIAVFVATPTQTHFEIAKKIILSNKHLFLEKPGTTCSEELQQINELAKEKGLIFVVGYEFIHHSAIEKINKLIKGKTIGYINMEWFKWGTFKDSITTHLLCHELSIIQTLTKEKISNSHIIENPAISKSDICHSEFMAGKIKINSIINRISPDKRKTVTIGTDGGIYIWNNNELFVIHDQKMTELEINSDSPVKREINDFLNSIKENKKPKANGDFAVEVYKSIENLRQNP